MPRERPELRPEPAVARLHLVRDVEPSRGVGPLHEQLELGRLGHMDAVAHERPVEERRSEPAFELLERGVQRAGEVGAAPWGGNAGYAGRQVRRRPVLG